MALSEALPGMHFGAPPYLLGSRRHLRLLLRLPHLALPLPLDVVERPSQRLRVGSESRVRQGGKTRRVKQGGRTGYRKTHLLALLHEVALDASLAHGAEQVRTGQVMHVALPIILAPLPQLASGAVLLAALCDFRGRSVGGRVGGLELGDDVEELGDLVEPMLLGEPEGAVRCGSYCENILCERGVFTIPCEQ